MCWSRSGTFIYQTHICASWSLDDLILNYDPSGDAKLWDIMMIQAMQATISSFQVYIIAGFRVLVTWWCPCMIDCGCKLSTDARYMKVSASHLFDLIIPDGLDSSDSDLRADYCRKTRGLSQYISTGNTVIDQRKLKCALAVSVFDVKIGAFFQ